MQVSYQRLSLLKLSDCLQRHSKNSLDIADIKEPEWKKYRLHLNDILKMHNLQLAASLLTGIKEPGWKKYRLYLNDTPELVSKLFGISDPGY